MLSPEAPASGASESKASGSILIWYLAPLIVPLGRPLLELEPSMETKTISSADALLMAKRQEDHFFDRKAAAITGAKLQKVAVAFANADGGEIYIGVASQLRKKGGPELQTSKTITNISRPLRKSSRHYRWI